MKQNTFLVVLSLLSLCAFPLLAGGADRYAGLDNAKYLGEVRIQTTLTSRKPFTEGPAVDAEGNVFFTNAGEILKWNPKEKALAIFRKPSNEANGEFFDAQGRLLVCESGDATHGRVTRTDMHSGQVTVLCDSFGGFPLGAPNDLTTDDKGRIYFTSRLGNTDPVKGNINAVYRIDPDGKTARILASPEIDMPNGLAISPDNRTFYLIESDGRANHARNIRAYDLNSDGSVANMRVLFDFYPGRGGDGMRIDAEGNLVVAAGLHKTRRTSETLDTRPGIHVISPQGKLLAFVETPEDTLTNCAFGGEDLKTLYVTCGKYLLSIRMQIPGMASYRPGK
jgi:gluconolactonase